MSVLVKTKTRLFYGYVVVAASSLIIMVLYGVRNSFGVFFNPLVAEFGWSRAATSSVFSFSFLIVALCGIIVGRLNDRFGPRLVLTVCGLSLGIGFLLMSQVNTVWQFYLIYGGLVAVGISGAIPLISSPARWFIKYRGLMSGVILTGVGLGTIILPPVTTWLINSFNWRISYAVVGVTSLLIILPLTHLLVRNPEQIGLTPYGSKEVEDKRGKQGIDPGLSPSQALKKPQFWMISIGYFCYNFGLQTVLVHIVPYAIGTGISGADAAIIMSIIGALSIPGRLVMGSASDRFRSRGVVTICFALLIGSLIWLLFASSLWSFFFFALVFGFTYGGQAACQSPMIADFFGTSSHSTIFGYFSFIFTCGAIGPTVAGRIFDVTGSYSMAFSTCLVIVIIGVTLIIFTKNTVKQLAVKT